MIIIDLLDFWTLRQLGLCLEQNRDSVQGSFLQTLPTLRTFSQSRDGRFCLSSHMVIVFFQYSLSVTTSFPFL